MVYVSKWFQKTATAGDEHMPQRMRRCMAQDLARLSAQISAFNMLNLNLAGFLSTLLVCHFGVLIWSLMFVKAHLNFQMPKQ